MLVGRYCIRLGMKRSVNDSSIGLIPLFGAATLASTGSLTWVVEKFPNAVEQ